VPCGLQSKVMVNLKRLFVSRSVITWARASFDRNIARVYISAIWYNASDHMKYPQMYICIYSHLSYELTPVEGQW
jgi:hypothetical protein